MTSQSPNASALHERGGSPQLRQQRLNGGSRPDTIEEGQAFSFGLKTARRSSSFMTDSSFEDARNSMRASTEDLFMPRSTGRDHEHQQEPSLWFSLPLLFAIVPAVVGVAFKKGSIFITDLALLILAAIYLNWCLTTPWIWYHSAQTLKIAKPPLPEVVESESAIDGHSGQNVQDGESPSEEPTKREQQHHKDTALQELELHELMALAMCFVGPLLGAYILHTIRSSLSNFGDELVSNMHLTLFVLGAELRPVRQTIRLVQARTLHLQKLVRQDPHAVEQIGQATLQDLSRRMNEIEVSYSDTVAKHQSTSLAPPAVSTDSFKQAQTAIQIQIDALTRAVRRYEKRTTAQTIQGEARLQDLESRLKDALSLAAVAAGASRNSGTFMTLLNWLSSIVVLPLQALQTVVLYPLNLASKTLLELSQRVGLVRPVRSKRPASKPSQLSSRSFHPDKPTPLRSMKKA